MDENETILVEIRERIIKLEVQITEMLKNMERYNSFEGRIVKVESELASACSHINALEANSTWIWRTIGGAIIVAVIAMLLN